MAVAGVSGDGVKVLVNAASVKEGGPLVVLDQLLQNMPLVRPDIEWAIAAHSSVRQPWNEQNNIAQVDVGHMDAHPLGVLHWYEVGLPAAVKRMKPDVVFSITNYLPLRRLPVFSHFS